MGKRLTKIAVRIDEKLAEWSELDAAKEGIGLRRFFARLVRSHIRSNDAYQNAMRRALSRRPFLKSDSRYLSREEAHDRARTR